MKEYDIWFSPDVPEEDREMLTNAFSAGMDIENDGLVDAMISAAPLTEESSVEEIESFYILGTFADRHEHGFVIRIEPESLVEELREIYRKGAIRQAVAGAQGDADSEFITWPMLFLTEIRRQLEHYGQGPANEYCYDWRTKTVHTLN